jgi:hypothetical protein
VTRLPVVAFAALVVATVGAFFVTQHLKVTTPLINGSPAPDPTAINPVSGRVCLAKSPDGQLVRKSFRRMRISFYLQHRADDVGVYVVDSGGTIVATLATSRHMRVGVRNPDGEFSWNGREDDGSIAPDGTYYIRIALQHEGRTIELTGKPIRVITVPPHPVVTGVRAPGQSANGPAIVAPPATPVTIHYRRGPFRTAFIEIYRTDLPGKPRRVFSFGTSGRGRQAVWNGLIRGAPAPAGTYLIGMQATDQACNLGSFPIVDPTVSPPAPGSTPHTGVTVRYLAAEPPLAPVGAGDVATVYVDSQRQPYTWALRRAGYRKVLAHGRGTGFALRVRMPALGAMLYDLSIRSHGHRTIVPLVASAQGRRAAARVLVVLPALTWQGENPVDTNGDGVPETLTAGDRIALDRVLVQFPAAFGDEAALLTYLNKEHLPYQLTTDVALAQGVGPPLTGHSGVILNGSFRWLPAGLAPMLKAFAQNGRRVVAIGPDSLHRTAKITRTAAGLATAGPPSAASATDVFGAGRGPLVTGNHDPIIVISDGLNIFGTTSGAFTGFGSYQPITPPGGSASGSVSAAGVTDTSPSITGFHVGRGTVVEIGARNFASSLAHDVDSQELMNRLFQILRG